MKTRLPRAGTISSSASSALTRPPGKWCARDVFAPQDLRFGHEYVDFVWVDQQGLRHIDYAKIDATRPVSSSAAGADDPPSPAGAAMEPAGVSDETEEEGR